jgi:hypothetical protein
LRQKDRKTNSFYAARAYIKKYRSSSFSPSDLGDRFTLGEQEKVEEIVLSTEFQNLPNFHTYLKIANFGVTKMKTDKKFLDTNQPEFVQRDFKLERPKPTETEKPAKEKK